MSDILRVFAKLVPEDLPSIGVHLVETSPKMRALQEKKLKGFSKLTFHHRLDQVPKEFSFFLAHEFFDALPIHKFVKATPEELKAAKERRPPSSSENGKGLMNRCKLGSFRIVCFKKKKIIFFRQSNPIFGSKIALQMRTV